MITPRTHSNLFFLGIGGMGMVPLALYLKESGWSVSGYDDELRPASRQLLEDAGISLGERASLPADAEQVIFSSAVKGDHPIMREACARGLATVRRGSMMATALAGRKLVAVAGSHGKTTTAGMLIHALDRSGFACDYLLGGLFADAGRNPARFRGSEWIVAEIDESDGTIEEFRPEIALVVNLDWDHTDQYREPDDLLSAFNRLLERTSGSVFFPVGSDCLRSMGGVTGAGRFTFGEGGDYNLRSVTARRASLDLQLDGRFPPVTAEVAAVGRFNALNATAALAVAHHLTGGTAPRCLADFPGILRRQVSLYDLSGVTVLEDYAHHPAEIGALLAYGREGFRTHRQIVVFQPHRYSRTKQFKEAFAEVLQGADEVFLLDVYPACEDPLEGGLSGDLFAALEPGGKSHRVASPEELWACLSPGLNQPCLVLFVGAGDIDQWARDFVGRLDNSALRPGPSMAGIDVSWWHAFAEQIQSRSTVRFDEPLAEKTTLRVGGPAFLYAEPATADDLSDLLRAAQERQLPVFFLGRGSNLIVPDEGFRGLVVRLSGSSWNEVSVLPDHRIYAGGGARLKQICGEACKQGLSGFEFLEGIPGSMGGALRMNAGAMGAWIFDVVEEVRIMTLDGVLHTLTREAFHVGYRDCRELRDAIAVGATLRASGSADPEVIRKKIGGFSRKRRESQPREPSSGCIFKNPEGHFAGQLIDELGLKGKRLGAAQVSEVHGNFIVNRGGATSGDVIGLINAIRREVRNRRGIVLQPEVLLMGQLWGDDL